VDEDSHRRADQTARADEAKPKEVETIEQVNPAAIPAKKPTIGLPE
jgi:hypothetical protein